MVSAFLVQARMFPATVMVVSSLGGEVSVMPRPVDGLAGLFLVEPVGGVGGRVVDVGEQQGLAQRREQPTDCGQRQLLSGCVVDVGVAFLDLPVGLPGHVAAPVVGM